MPTPAPTPSPWPNGAKAAVSFTMDNLGEAQDVLKGTWPAGRPLGAHPAVAGALPRMLALLGARGVRATYFAESWSLAVYPGAVRGLLLARGHEVAWHGFQHEAWAGLSGDEERGSFARSWDALRAFNGGLGGGDGGVGDGGKEQGEGEEEEKDEEAEEEKKKKDEEAETTHRVKYDGFRPPGGRINGERTLGLLAAHGVRYVSPLGGSLGVVEGGRGQGLVVLPFEWEAVDAFYYMDKFAAVRAARGAPEAPLAPADLGDRLARAVDAAVAARGYLSVLFHPFLTTTDERLRVVEDVLARIAGDPDVWCAPCNEVARWVSEHSERFPSLKGYGS